jgi:hypothetical protein
MIRLYTLLAAAAIGLSFWAGWSWRGDRAEGAEFRQQAHTSTSVVDQVNRARATEHTQADTMSTIGAKHEEERTAAEAVPSAVVADLRTGDLQLRDDLATCTTSLLSQAVASTIERDAHAQLRAEVAGALVQVGRDANDHVKSCQAVIVADRAVVP